MKQCLALSLQRKKGPGGSLLGGLGPVFVNVRHVHEWFSSGYSGIFPQSKDMLVRLGVKDASKQTK